MTDFVNKCGANCRMSEMPLHWYDTTFEKLQAYVEQWSAFKLPMRVTEYACTVCHTLLFGVVGKGANRIHARVELQWP